MSLKNCEMQMKMKYYETVMKMKIRSYAIAKENPLYGNENLYETLVQR